MVTQPNPTPYNEYPTPGSPPTTGAAAEVSRRALFATAGLGVCAAAVVGTPIALKAAEQYAQQYAEQQVSQAVQGVYKDLQKLEVEGEEIALDAALAAANLTKLAVQYIVLPVASLAATIGGDAIGALKSAVDNVRGFIKNFGQDISQLDALSNLLGTWHTNLTQLPVSLSAISNADINSAQAYLTALQAKINQNVGSQASSTPTATP